MGVKEVGVPPKTYTEILKMVEDGLDVERAKLYDKAPLYGISPRYNHHAKETMAFAPWYPEMNQVGYDHKVHGNIVIPDYRVYQIPRVAPYRPELQTYLKNLEAEGLQDPWIRNNLWRMDPYAGIQPAQANVMYTMGRGLISGFIIALGLFTLKKTYEAIYPPVAKPTDRWWERREKAPEDNVIRNRYKPARLIMAAYPVSFNPKYKRGVIEDYGVDHTPKIKEYYSRDKDPALMCE